MMNRCYDSVQPRLNFILSNPGPLLILVHLKEQNLGELSVLDQAFYSELLGKIVITAVKIMLSQQQQKVGMILVNIESFLQISEVFLLIASDLMDTCKTDVSLDDGGVHGNDSFEGDLSQLILLKVEVAVSDGQTQNSRYLRIHFQHFLKDL